MSTSVEHKEDIFRYVFGAHNESKWGPKQALDPIDFHCTEKKSKISLTKSISIGIYVIGNFIFCDDTHKVLILGEYPPKCFFLS